MSEIKAWRFLVSRNQFLDYRTVVAPDFMCQANIASLLAKAAEGDPTNDDSVYYCEIYGSKVGDLTIIYRVKEAQARDVDPETNGALKDSFGREIYFIEGLVIKGINPSISVTVDVLELNHQKLVNDYRDFWEWVSPQTAIASKTDILDLIENNATLNRIDLPAYFIGSKKELVLTKTSQPRSEIKEKNSDVFNKQISAIPVNAEVHQCFFLNDSEVIVYLRPNILPHYHKVTTLNINTKNQDDLISGEAGKRSIERICLASNKQFIVNSNRSLAGKDENSNSPLNFSIHPCFTKVFNLNLDPDLTNKGEALVYEGGGELIAISKDCKWVANATDNALNPDLFDIKGGGKRPLSGGHNKKITTLAASLHENTFASGDEGGFLRIWNFSTLDSIGGLEIFKSPIDAIAFSPCKRLIACSGNEGEIKLYKYDSDKFIKESLIELKHIGSNGRKSKVNDLCFSSDGKMFASAGYDGSIRLWNLEKGENQNSEILSGHNKPVMSISFSPNRKLLASGSKDKTVRIWQLS
ncbi:MAG: WD40 repeat domain-containing protein [Pseudanabaenaceae cyanobacterium bins.39]|jgi:WD40 repeat protein|nr:WD40 repeat domain-containing protein [Pseudanabaenaceae cyanobacterium bins.39]